MPSGSSSIMTDYSAQPTIDLTLDDEHVQLSNAAYPRIAQPHPTRHSPNKSHLQFRTNHQTPPFPASLPSVMSTGMANMMIQTPSIPQINHPQSNFGQAYPQSLSMSSSYRPPFASNNMRQTPFPTPQQFATPPPAPFTQQLSQPQPSPPTPISLQPSPNVRNIIDLTSSPSPEPRAANTLPVDLPPKTPVCIGQLTVTALVLYPVPYLSPENHQGGPDADWACVRLQYEHNPDKVSSPDTIHIRTPHMKTRSGEAMGGETFGVVEQKIATSIGPMLGKGLIRLEARVRKGLPNVNNPDLILLQLLISIFI